ncbi:hypothetical protein RDI58_026189 [Solanum bulbocastanum]|uniref:F-box associated beta-propeller type 3 domain-containing protein n=1 Tax=Solanum bulbocastanum TaxID=147425 RepID=A0AAN8STA3_SOLBU
MAQKRKNNRELPNSFTTKKQKMKKKSSFMFSALLSPLFSLLTNNNFLSKLLGKKTPLIHLQKPSIDQPDVHDRDVQKLKLDCPSTLKPRHCMIHYCYNGLAIIEIRDTDRIKFLLWNPSIRESIVLPPLECPRYQGSRFGLGYDSSSGDYKILHMHQNVPGLEYPNEILALKDGSWRSIDEYPCANRRWFYAMDYLPFIHAAFHWLEVSIKFFVVFSFDISNEVYREIPLSEKILSLRSCPNDVGVSALEGMLCVHSNISLFYGKGYF